MHRLLYADPGGYVAHPHMAVLPDGAWVMVANRGPRRRMTLHPPHDPDFCNIVLRSEDQGRSWSDPVVVGEPGTECAGLTTLADGTMLLHQFRFRWYRAGQAPPAGTDMLLADAAGLRQERFGSRELEAGAGCEIDWSRGGGSATIRRSLDGGKSFAAPSVIDTTGYSGGYGMRGAAVLGDGEIVLPLCDPPHYRRVFAVRSRDGGHTWQAPGPVAESAGCAYEEPAPIVLGDGTILLLLRDNVSHTLHAVRSRDRGASWSPPWPTGIEGYPAHLLGLADGRLAAIVGCRTEPFRIAAFLSQDDGASWQLPGVTVAGLDHRDLGYPTAAGCHDGSLFIAWYHRDGDGITGLHYRFMTL